MLLTIQNLKADLLERQPFIKKILLATCKKLAFHESKCTVYVWFRFHFKFPPMHQKLSFSNSDYIALHPLHNTSKLYLDCDTVDEESRTNDQ